MLRGQISLVLKRDTWADISVAATRDTTSVPTLLAAGSCYLFVRERRSADGVANCCREVNSTEFRVAQGDSNVKLT